MKIATSLNQKFIENHIKLNENHVIIFTTITIYLFEFQSIITLSTYNKKYVVVYKVINKIIWQRHLLVERKY